MKSIWLWVLSGICLLLMVWCNINTYFINQNTERIEEIIRTKSIIRIDTFYVFPIIRADTVYISFD